MSFNVPPLWPSGTAPAEEFCSDDKRLVMLASFDADAIAGDEELARITRFAAQLCGASSAAVSLIETERQRFLASAGLDVEETPRSTSFCSRTMLRSDVLEVLDTSNDPTFADFSLVTGPAKLRYYAGAPLISGEGAPLGALCVLDTVPRTEPLSDMQREGLMVLAESVMRRLHSHRAANTAGARLQASAERLQSMLDSVPDIAWSAASGPKFDYFNARFTEVTGMPACDTVEDWRAVIHPEDYEQSLAKFERALKTASLFDDEWRLRQADGSYRWILSRAVPSNNDPETARWFGTLTDIHDRYQLSQDRDMLAGELAHRIKNIFSVITGLVVLHARGQPGLKIFADTLSDHIRALARAQDFALQIGAKSAQNLIALLEVLMAPYGVPGHGAVTITGEDVATGPKSATPLALVFHELATNSAKYGALSTGEGRLSIHLTCIGENVQIAWRETGGPEATPPEETGFGSRLVKMAVEHQLGGSITQDWRKSGLAADIIVSAERLEN